MYKMYINGKCVEGAGDKLDVTCPATGELLETITTASIQQADEALEAAQAAFHDWARLSLNERIGWMMKLKDACLAEKDEIVDLMAKEAASPGRRPPTTSTPLSATSASMPRRPSGCTAPTSPSTADAGVTSMWS